ncbi:MAG: DUF433 domain-containing protein, partial [Bacteroidetes bacterium]
GLIGLAPGDHGQGIIGLRPAEPLVLEKFVEYIFHYARISVEYMHKADSLHLYIKRLQHMTLSKKSIELPLRQDEHGVIRIGDSRVSLDLIIQSWQNGFSAEEIASQFTAISLADVYASICFYLQNQEQVDAYLAENEKLAKALRKEIESTFPSSALRKKLLQNRPQ